MSWLGIHSDLYILVIIITLFPRAFGSGQKHDFMMEEILPTAVWAAFRPLTRI